MKPRPIILGAVFVLIASLSAGNTAAWGPAAPKGPPTLQQVEQGAPHNPLDRQQFATSERPTSRRMPAPAAAAAPDIQVGQPGLSFRYVEAFGQTGVPYFEDTNHLNFPYALATDGDNVWIGEAYGHRVLQFTNGGTYVKQVGKVGINNYPKETVRRISDEAVDPYGNIWVADIDAGHVLKYGPDLKYVSELGQIWNHGSGNDQFDQPTGIAFDAAGNIYVSDGAPEFNSDYGNHRIQIFDKNSVYLATIGQTRVAGSANNQLHGPRHIAIYGDRLYVADSGNHRVQIFNISNPASPSYAGTIGVTGASGDGQANLHDPSGVAVNANYIYVADEWNNRVQIFSRSAPYSFQATIGGTYGTANDQFRQPTDVAVDASGYIYVADYQNQRVQQFSPAHAYVRTYGTTGIPYLTDRVHFNEPQGVAVARDGSVYVTEEYGHRLVKLDAAGNPLWSIGEPGMPGGWNGESNLLNTPSGAAVDDGGRVYVADRYNDRIQIYEASGTYHGTLGVDRGTGNGQFSAPQGVAFGPNGNLYVADTGNERVQIFDRNLAYAGTLGVPGISGSDSAHFNRPVAVAVDSNGVIYVADANNARVQVFAPDRSYLRTIGVTGAGGDDFGHLQNPMGLAVDAARNVYVGDGWATRVQVYDASGAYLTSFATSWGPRSGQSEQVRGLAVGPDGAVYVVDSWDNYRITKFAPGVPGWRQTNINGFGDRWAQWASSLLPFQGSLYAAGYPARVWRMTAGGVWSQASADGFGDPTNNEIDAMAEFGGYLYVATYTWVCDDQNCNTGHPNGPQIRRSPDGSTWDDVTPAGSIGSGDRYVATFAVFNGYLYAALGHGDSGAGAEIWRTADGLVWTRVAQDGFDDIYNSDVLSLVEYSGSLYAGTRHGDWTADQHANGPLGGEVWRSADGATGWTRVNAAGFGDVQAHRVEKLLVFKNGLYAYVSHVGGTAAGADVWRCTETTCAGQADWTKVATNGFGPPLNQYLYSGVVSGDYLYAAVQNRMTGVQLWRTPNGSTWEKATPYDGLGNSNNTYVSGGAMTTFRNRLSLAVTNSASGIGVWEKTLTPDFTATPTRGAAPLTVQFTNTSAGDLTSSQWDFGDGEVSTEANPTHIYTKLGAYTVTLTVSDGTDTSTVAKLAYIQVKKYVYLPLVFRPASK